MFFILYSDYHIYNSIIMFVGL